MLRFDRKQQNSVKQFSSVQSCLTFADPWTATRQASLSITNSRSLLKLMFIELLMPSNHLILCYPLSSCLQSFQASGSFSMSQFFTSGGQSIGVSASASVLPINIQDWFPLGWTCWISLQSKGLSRVFSNTTVQSINVWVWELDKEESYDQHRQHIKKQRHYFANQVPFGQSYGFSNSPV